MTLGREHVHCQLGVLGVSPGISPDFMLSRWGDGEPR